MPRRNWKTFRAHSLSEAIEASLDFARERHNRNVDRIADLMGLSSKWTLYKWVESGGLPVRQLASFEHACGCHFVTAYLAVATHKLLIDYPTGRTTGTSDIHAVQEVCNAAVGALIGFADGKASAPEVLDSIGTALERLAFERANVERHHQPELELDGSR